MKKKVLLFLLVVALYLILGAIAPFLVQPGVREQTKSLVRNTAFLSNSPGKERVMLISENGDALEERLRLISQARERIILSTFDFRADKSGKAVLSALQAAANRGVQVQILVDGNSAALHLAGNPYFKALSAMDEAEIRIYNPLNLLTPWKLMGRLHDKYLIADDTAYILGGRNTNDYFLGDHSGCKNLDLDMLVFGAGESHHQVLSYFESVWTSKLCKPYHSDRTALRKISVKKAAAELEALYTAMKEALPTWFQPCDYEAKTVPANKIQLVTNPSHCYAKEPVVFYTITELMGQGKEQVSFHTPYVIANDWMLERLSQACQAVPQVTMMTNAPANNANLFGSMDYLRHKDQVLETGVQIQEYDGGNSYHGKCFAVDNRLSGVGSFNWDMRSTYLDTEMMLVIDSEDLNSALREYMAAFEEKSLTVVDGETFIIPEGHTPQEMPGLQKLLLSIVHAVAGWARFLL